MSDKRFEDIARKIAEECANEIICNYLESEQIYSPLFVKDMQPIISKALQALFRAESTAYSDQSSTFYPKPRSSK